jgi:hypothetical protein
MKLEAVNKKKLNKTHQIYQISPRKKNQKFIYKSRIVKNPPNSSHPESTKENKPSPSLSFTVVVHEPHQISAKHIFQN